jgi:uncharacterized protein (DUF302 family)
MTRLIWRACRVDAPEPHVTFLSSWHPKNIEPFLEDLEEPMSPYKQTALGLVVKLDTNFEAALSRTVDALKGEGFGVLTEIDVKETMKKKLGIDYPPYKILGACNPPLANRALMAAPEVGLLLPCNVTVRELPGGGVEVALIDPLVMLGVVAAPELRTVAEEARERLERVAAVLSLSLD